MSALHDMGVAFRRWRQVRAKGAAPEGMSGDEFRAAAAPLIDAAAPEIAEAAFVDLPATRMPWTATDFELQPGEEVTLLSVGRIWLARPLDIWVGPQFQLWARLGETGEVFNGTQDTMTFTADRAGRLYLGGQFPGQFADRQGRLQPDLNAYAKSGGGLTVLAIRWRNGAAAGLDAMAKGRDVTGLVTAERARLANPPQPPEGWRYLWFLGESDIYAPGEADGAPCIHCRTHRNVGILQKEAPFPLRPDTELSWDWKVDVLPTALPEDTAASHDYLSIAVEFENGRDITYYWSRELPVGKGYWCPLPTWKDREFHVVVRSGERELGQWLSETRNLYTDYRDYMGEPPARVVRVWLIANSLFQRMDGAADFRKISLAGGGDQRDIL